MNVRPAGREPCACSSPINQILERLDQMDVDIQAAQQAANTAVGTANSQAGVAAASAASAAQDASDALGHAAAAQQSADDALLEATNAAGSAQDAADDLADALLAIQNIESTIASVLATDIGAKVDKLTTAGFHLYTHNGSTQGEVAPDINPTAATIPIRDSAGKLFGADPANGATDKTLTTANWISQTGDSAPNNLMHRNGNETKTGILTTSTPFLFASSVAPSNNSPTRTNWYRILTIPITNFTFFEGMIYGELNNVTLSIAKFYFTIRNANEIGGGFVYNKKNNNARTIRAYITSDGTNLDMWVLEAQYTAFRAYIERALYYTTLISTPSITAGDLATTADPSTFTGVTTSAELTIMADVI